MDVNDIPYYICFAFLIFTISLIPLVLIGSVISMPRHTEIDEYDVFYVDAPFGRFYGDVSAPPGFLGSGKITTSPSEAYTVKYWDDDEIKTIILSALSDNVHVTLSENVTVTHIYSYRNNLLGEESWRHNDWYITINATEEMNL